MFPIKFELKNNNYVIIMYVPNQEYTSLRSM